MTARYAAALALIAVLDRENAALAAMDLAVASACLEAKGQALDALTQTGDSPLDAETMSRLDTAARLNQTLLRRALATQARVIEIMRGAIDAAPDAPRYNAAGAWAVASRAEPRALLARV